MNTRPTIVIVACSVVGAFLFGRCSVRPAPVPAVVTAEEEHHEVSEEHVQQAVASTTSTQAAAAVAKHSRLRRYRPDGTLASERVDDVDARTAEATKTDSVGVQTLWRDKVVNNETRVTAVTPRDIWALTAIGGLDWSGNKVIGGSIARRLVGPVYVGAWATNQAAGLSVGFGW